MAENRQTIIASRSDFRLSRELFEALLKFNREVRLLTADEMIGFVLEEAVRLTESRIGFCHFVGSDQNSIRLKAWSEETVKMCSAEENEGHYPLEKAGIWADCVRSRKPMICNDYRAEKVKKSLPKGHVQVSRFISIPVFDGDNIVSVFGVGNKEGAYEHQNLETLTLLAENMWLVISRKQNREELEKSHAELEKKVEERTAELRETNNNLRKEIEERKKAEEEKSRLERRYFALFDNIGSGVAVYRAVDSGRNFVFEDMNTTGEKMTLVKREEILGRFLTEVMPGVEPFGLLEVLRKVYRTGVSERFPVTKYEDRNLKGWFENYVYKLPSGEVVAVFDNLTEKKRAEEELKASEARFRLAIVEAPYPVAIHADDGEFLQLSSTWTELTGYDLENTPTIFDFLEKARGIKKAEVFEKVGRLYAMTQRTDEGESTIFTANGEKRVWQLSSAPLGKLSDGRKAVVTIASDITDLKRTEEQLSHAQKMESMGTLAGGIAHEFNNILGGIMGYAEIIKDDLPVSGAAVECLEKIIDLGVRARDVVRQVLSFSRKGVSVKKVVEPHVFLKEEMKLLQAIIPSNIDIQTEIDDRSGAVLGDMSLLQQVGMNLCVNASHAMEENGGILQISLLPVVLDAEEVKFFRDLVPGEYIKLSVSDTGEGIDPEIIDRIFDPFFTTKGVGKGTGMGLSVAHGIVKDHGGEIRVESEPGRGSTFTVFLPKVSEEPDENPKPKLVSTGTENILLVDDEESITNVIGKMLERLGYKVTALTNSLEALALIKKHPDGYDLIITDLTMPHLTGDRLAAEVRAVRKDLPVVLITGYGDAIENDKVKKIGIKAFIAKPCRKHELAKTIRMVLDGS